MMVTLPETNKSHLMIFMVRFASEISWIGAFGPIFGGVKNLLLVLGSVNGSLSDPGSPCQMR